MSIAITDLDSSLQLVDTVGITKYILKNKIVGIEVQGKWIVINVLETHVEHYATQVRFAYDDVTLPVTANINALIAWLLLAVSNSPVSTSDYPLPYNYFQVDTYSATDKPTEISFWDGTPAAGGIRRFRHVLTYDGADRFLTKNVIII